MAVISTSWSCARCGAAYISTPPEDGLCDDCTVRLLREIFFGTRQIALSAVQTDYLRDMLADAVAYRRARTGACSACRAASQECTEHDGEETRIEAYQQLATILNGG
jgi:hypothetical protein